MDLNERLDPTLCVLAGKIMDYAALQTLMLGIVDPTAAVTMFREALALAGRDANEVTPEEMIG